MRGEEIILGARSLLLRFGTILLVASCFAPPVSRALAAGGGGGGSCISGPGVGGAGGTSSTTGSGGAGGSSTGCGGGGGGGAGVTGGAGGGTGNAVGGAGGTSAGASGGDGDNFFFAGGGGGGGGGGAHGAVVTTSTSNSGSVTGGGGGRGGSPMVSVPGAGGGGGGGGYGVVVNGSGLTYGNTGTVKGGTGGNGGFSIFDVGGFGGNGGDGVVFTGSSGALVNSGTIAGGNGGAGGSGSSNGLAGLGGVGIVGTNLSIVNSGSITGGLGGNGSTRANAIFFTGGSNVLELRAGSIITGNVVGTNSDTLRLGGTADSTFDVSALGTSLGSQYSGFSTFVKAGSSTWTLTGTTLAFTPWTIDQGTLAVSSDSNLGNVVTGELIFNGGALQFLAGFSSNRTVTLNAGGGFFDTNGNSVTLAGTIGGAGDLTKLGAGTLTLTGTSGYAGATNVNAGTLEVDGSIASSSSVTVNSGATLSGTGIVDPATTTIMAGGTLAPGNASNPAGMLTITGNLAFQSAAIYRINVGPSAASSVNVTGSAALGGATVNAVFNSTSYVNKLYSILIASGGVSGTFASGVANTNLPAGFLTSLSYDATHAYLNVSMNLMPNSGGGMSGNQQNSRQCYDEHLQRQRRHSDGLRYAERSGTHAGFRRTCHRVATDDIRRDEPVHGSAYRSLHATQWWSGIGEWRVALF